MALPRSRSSVTRSLHRSVALLRLLSTHTQIGWRLSDLAEESGLDLGTCHRLLAALCEDRLATRVAGGRHYTLGPLAYELGVAARPYFELGTAAATRLAALARQLRGSLILKVRSGPDSLCVARHDGIDFGQALMLHVGGRRPLLLTAGGVAMLIRLPPATQDEILAHNQSMIARTAAPRLDGVRRMLHRSRQVGFGLNLGDIVPDICAVSVAVLRPDGLPGASLSLALAASSLGPQRAAALADRLGEEVARLTPELAILRF